MKLLQPCIRSMAVHLLVVVATGFLSTVNSRGQETTSTTRSTTGTAGDAAKQRRAQLPFAKGTLVSNDLLRRILKVKTEDGTRTFFYTEHVYIFRGKEKITPDKLIVGEIVALRFDTDSEGRAMVRRIKAYGTAPADGTKPHEANEPAK